ncbi:MAG TPA: four helix bundle protein [Phycisphaerae bacterium]|nr:four helix bundle protein [Phycisphaerae bacterium]
MTENPKSLSSLAAPGREEWIERAHRFGVAVLKIVNRLPNSIGGRAMGFQMAKSGPSVAHNLEEAKGAATVPDRYNKTVIARKEARKCHRSLELVRHAAILAGPGVEWAIGESGELVAMLTAGSKRMETRVPKRKPR